MNNPRLFPQLWVGEATSAAGTRSNGNSGQVLANSNRRNIATASHGRTILVDRIVGNKALPDEVVGQIADRTDGVPLFIEELTKSVLESGLLREEADRYVLDHALPARAIPATLQASLMARLDRMPPVRRLAQIGAAIGRDFSYELLSAVSRIPEDQPEAGLAALVASELVFQRGTPPEAGYTFKHALIQDAAHESLLRRSRQQLHAPIAEALEAGFPDVTQSQPEILAQHYTEAGLVEKSVAYWGKAGHRSAARSARKQPHNSKRGWTSWRCCRTTLHASDRSSNFAVHWARRCNP